VSALLYRFGRWCAEHAVRVLAAWLLIILMLGGAVVLTGGKLNNTFTISGTESMTGLDILAQRLPQAAGTSEQVLITADDGDIENHRDAVDGFVQSASDLDGVALVSQPFGSDASGSTPATASTVSDDGAYVLIQIQADISVGSMTSGQTDKAATLSEALDELVAATEAGDPDLTIQLGGTIGESADIGLGPTELIGVGIAAVVLLATFGSVVAAGAPLVAAFIGVGVGMLGILLAASATSINSTTPVLAVMIGLAVGIDYALFIISRAREYLADGVAPDEAAGRAVATSGSAVVFAGTTVILALCGLSVARIPFLTVMGVASAAVVAVAVAVALSVVPALIGVAGTRMRPSRRRVGRGGRVGTGGRSADRRDIGARRGGPSPARPSARRIIGLVLGAVVFLAPLVLDVPGLDDPGERMLSIFLLAIVLWVTEAIPLVATAVLVIGLEVLLVSDQALLPVPAGATHYAEFLAALANPVIILFLGGFLIADGAAKYHLDKNLAAVLIKPFTGSARRTVLGLMVITALLSMFMSNTATTATMFAVVIPILGALPEGRPRAGLALSIPVAANVGGIGTPVGTPPNAIALGALAERGHHISFASWMVMAVPLMLVILLGAWLLLIVLFIPAGLGIELDMRATWHTDRRAVTFYVIAAATILLWMTESLHGMSANVVGFLAVIALLVTGVMGGEDLGRLSWPVLWLVAGGIALGDGVGDTGLDVWLLGLFDWGAMPALAVVVVMGALGLAMSNVISHSAASNLLIPLAMGLAGGIEGLEPVTIAVVLALACSLGMSLPISTPPNAIAYATGEVSTADMARVGIVIGVAGTTVLVLVMPTLWSWMRLV